MTSFVLAFGDIDKTRLALAGGKGANLGELARIEGIRVPDGFCVTTEAFKRVVGGSPRVKDLLDRLSVLKLEDRDQISELSAGLRGVIEGIAIPGDIREEVSGFLSRLGEEHAYAIRSSATAEDLPSASFAGQQDTYLNITGIETILKHIGKCWASLFTDRAVVYRIQTGFDHRKVQLAVVVQKMVFPQAAGILFTADPVDGNRKVSSIDAGFGLGEALVSGLVSADNYKLRAGKIIEQRIATKKLAIYAMEADGTKEQELEPELQTKQTLPDERILELERIGRKIEAHFGSPQDIEWCLADDRFYIVQSRPITTLFPVPDAGDQQARVYISVGHQQMMTDAIKPLGLSFFLMMTRAPMRTAGGRLFVDVTAMLATAAGRQGLLNTIGQSEPLIRDALVTIMERGFIPSSADDHKEAGPGKAGVAPPAAPVANDPSVVADLIREAEASMQALVQNIRTKAGPELFDLIAQDMEQLKQQISGPRCMPAVLASMNAAFWLNEKMKDWLGEKNVADTLAQSAPGNVTSEMGLELLDVADVIRPYPEVVAYLRQVKDGDFPDELVKLEGGERSREAIAAYLEKYGMRCAGEIDIARPRWGENPATLVPMILGNIKNFEPGEARRRFEQGLQEALKKEQELLEKLRQLPDGEEKAGQTQQMIGQLRAFAGYREHPKYHIVSRYFVYKQALLKEAERLVRSGVIHERDDIFFLSFEELREAVRTLQLDPQLIGRRKEAYRHYEKLTPPRMITSEGEIISGRYNREGLPAGALAGLAVSSGVVEGRARVILSMADADLEEGDILVTPFTDPSWTPLFVSIKGLVTEVGGLMTHGAVIAREYGLPAVVGVEKATSLIKDGQRIRVNGGEGWVELL